MEKRPFRPGKYYEYAGDLREYGYSARLNLYCQMDKLGNHKLELIDTGTMNRSAMLREITSIFDVDPLRLGVMRIDLAVDVPNIPVQWFRETVRVDRKRFRAAVTGEKFYSEMGTGDIQTLYFGIRPNVIRIYDKLAEYRKQYRDFIRKLPEGTVSPTFESTFDVGKNVAYLTRVERQYGARIPTEISTLGDVCAERFEHKPFANLKIIDHAKLPEQEDDITFETFCTARYLSSIASGDGMQALKTFISKHSKGNVAWAWKKYGPYLPSASDRCGLTNIDLDRRFAASFARHMERC